MTDIGNFKTGLFTGFGSAVGWDPASAKLFELSGFGTSSYHLTMVFGVGEFLMEAMDVTTDQPKFDAAWLDFCTLYNGTNAEKQARYGMSFSFGGFANVTLARYRLNSHISFTRQSAIRWSASLRWPATQW